MGRTHGQPSEGARRPDVRHTLTPAQINRIFLPRGTGSASEVAYLVGFQSPTALLRAFKRWTGQTPSTYRP